MTTSTDYGTPEERAARGAALLANKFGKNWGAKVDGRFLRMFNDYGVCALCQVSGILTYERACDKIGIHPYGEEAVSLGFYPINEMRDDLKTTEAHDAESKAIDQAFLVEAAKAL